MYNLSGWKTVAGPVLLFISVFVAEAQQRDPHIGYIYPSGGRQDTKFDITVGGQYLKGVSSVHVSGNGVHAEIIEHIMPLSKKQMSELGKKAKDIQKGQPGEKKMWTAEQIKEFLDFAKTLGLDDMDMEDFVEIKKKYNDPKRQPNAQIEELVNIRVSIDPDAEPGIREFRLGTGTGYTNPLFFHVGQYKEFSEKEPNDKTADRVIKGPLPVIVNGQIMPGDVDLFSFSAGKGMKLVISASARELIPYLADAVPGWFQATLKLYDGKGKAVAYTDDYRFHPDPILFYEVPEDGEYVLEIKDAIYRGREDFVYRIVLGEIPFVTGIFPLGGKVGSLTKLELAGWNLPSPETDFDGRGMKPGTASICASSGDRISNKVPFRLDTLSDCLENEPNDDPEKAQEIKLPIIINGRINKPGDWDVFCFKGRSGDEIVAEVHARRLESSLDSMLRLTDKEGKQLAVNDDYVDKGAGLTTHHADSRLSVKLPEDGTYYIYLGDTQHKGGSEYGYRLRVSSVQPDFELRVVPSCISGRAGRTVPITVYALRHDGFSGPVTLGLKDSPKGYLLSGGWIPADQEMMRMTLTLPLFPEKKDFVLQMTGKAVIDGKEVERTVVPAEDMMQAFLYRHLVPMKDWVVGITGKSKVGPPMTLAGKSPLKLSLGEKTQFSLTGTKGPLLSKISLELSDPPDGISISEWMPGKDGGLSITLDVDANLVKPGLTGNLIVGVFIENAAKTKDGKQKPGMRFQLGVLPAIPFEVIGEQPAETAKPE